MKRSALLLATVFPLAGWWLGTGFVQGAQEWFARIPGL